MDLVNENLNTCIRKIAIPSSIGFLFNTLFNITDTYFTGFISVKALAGLSLSFPVFFILISLGSGMGMGLSALISNAIGEKDKDKGIELAKDGILVGILTGLFISIVGLKFNRQLFLLMGAGEKELLLGMEYTKWIFIGAVFFCLNSIFNGILVAQGNTKIYRNFLIVGFVANVILDPFFIFILKTTTDGVAIATVLIQLVGSIYLYFKVKKSPLISKQNYNIKTPSVKNIKDILNQGLPASFNMMTIAVGVFVINHYIQKVGGSSAIASYGISTRIEQLILLPAIGLNSAALSITGQNFGAKKFDRIREIFIKTMLYGIIIMTIGMLSISYLLPYLFSIFTKDLEVIEYGINYFSIEKFTFNSYILINICDAVLRGLKYPKFSVLIGIYRQFLMPILCFPILIKFFQGIQGIWIGILIINWSAGFLFLGYFVFIYKKIKEKRKS
ncbi:MAG: MATE family efflux transporter [Cetobacterium sp.]|uniref:MATE family efflux transporter n=2 Tax=Fusobacteriaceae TaxID=203492 RepID=UPI001F06617A|nr:MULTISPECIES: MATE family efflux transporter [Cetobacterium]MCX3066424.1 MATE family efflux transporter [Cetobacterium somerae]UPO98313.1 MATE family efflux transporter [Cetobacterium somerae]